MIYEMREESYAATVSCKDNKGQRINEMNGSCEFLNAEINQNSTETASLKAKLRDFELFVLTSRVAFFFFF